MRGYKISGIRLSDNAGGFAVGSNAVSIELIDDPEGFVKRGKVFKVIPYDPEGKYTEYYKGAVILVNPSAVIHVQYLVDR